MHIDDVKNFLFKAVIRKRLCRVESKRARFAHDRLCPCPERRPLDAFECAAGGMYVVCCPRIPASLADQRTHFPEIIGDHFAFRFFYKNIAAGDDVGREDANGIPVERLIPDFVG